jgi:hypothetical protein
MQRRQAVVAAARFHNDLRRRVLRRRAEKELPSITEPNRGIAVISFAEVRGSRPGKQRSVPTKSELMREQAARLLSLSTQAREAGNADLADLLTEAAANCLANIVSDELEGSPPPQAAKPTQQPVAQQQQQIQPIKEGDEEGS